MFLPGEKSPGGLPLIQLAAPTLMVTGFLSFASDLQQAAEQNSGDKEKRA